MSSWPELLGKAVDALISASVGALFTLIGVIIANRFARQREERDRAERLEEAKAARKERLEHARREAMISHFKQVLEEIRTARASMDALFFQIDDSVVPDAEWQGKFAKAHTEFYSTLRKIPTDQLGESLEKDSRNVPINFRKDRQGVTRLTGYSEFSALSERVERRVAEILYGIYAEFTEIQ